MSTIRCELGAGNPCIVADAAQALRQGGLVAFPTETVYGLGADADSDAAVAAVYAAKGRPARNPLIVHVADMDTARRYGIFSETALALAERFWPGPLTLVLPRQENCPASALVSAGGQTVALRMPGHDLALALLGEFGRGIAAPSANRSGRISPTSARHVMEEFQDNPHALAMILDGGDTSIGIESTVALCAGGSVSVLRAGSITAEQVNAVETVHKARGALLSPGMLESHYAPRARVRLEVSAPQQKEAFLAFGATGVTGEAVRNLSPSGSLEEAAHHLYAYLRELDALGMPTIAVMPIPEEGVGIAINDRLRRAAAERE